MADAYNMGSMYGVIGMKLKGIQTSQRTLYDFLQKLDEKIAIINARLDAMGAKATAAGAKTQAGLGGKAVISSFDMMYNRMERFNKGLSVTAQRVRTFGYLASAVMTTAMVGASKAIFTATKDFEFSMQKIVGLAGTSQSVVNEWKQAILTMSPDVAKTPKELAEALYYISSSGIKGAKALDVLKVSAMAATAGLGDTKQVADILTSALNAYADTGLTATRAADILIAAVREGKGEADDFASSLGQIIPIAAQLGVSFDQVAGGMAAITLTGSSAQNAAVYLKGFFNLMLKSPRQGEVALKRLNLSYSELRKQLKSSPTGLIDAMNRLKKAADAVPNGDEILADILPNIRGLTAELSVAGRNFEYNTKLMDRVTNSSGSLKIAVDAVAQTLKIKLDKALAAIQVSLIKLGETIGPEIVKLLVNLTNRLEKLTIWWDNLSDAQKENRMHWALYIAVAGPVALVLSTLMYSFSGLYTGILKVGKVLKWLGQATVAAKAGAVALDGAVAAGAETAAASAFAWGALLTRLGLIGVIAAVFIPLYKKMIHLLQEGKDEMEDMQGALDFDYDKTTMGQLDKKIKDSVGLIGVYGAAENNRKALKKLTDEQLAELESNINQRIILSEEGAKKLAAIGDKELEKTKWVKDKREELEKYTTGKGMDQLLSVGFTPDQIAKDVLEITEQIDAAKRGQLIANQSEINDLNKEISNHKVLLGYLAEEKASRQKAADIIEEQLQMDEDVRKIWDEMERKLANIPNDAKLAEAAREPFDAATKSANILLDTAEELLHGDYGITFEWWGIKDIMNRVAELNLYLKEMQKKFDDFGKKVQSTFAVISVKKELLGPAFDADTAKLEAYKSALDEYIELITTPDKITGLMPTISDENKRQIEDYKKSIEEYTTRIQSTVDRETLALLNAEANAFGNLGGKVEVLNYQLEAAQRHLRDLLKKRMTGVLIPDDEIKRAVKTIQDAEMALAELQNALDLKYLVDLNDAFVHVGTGMNIISASIAGVERKMKLLSDTTAGYSPEFEALSKELRTLKFAEYMVDTLTSAFTQLWDTIIDGGKDMRKDLGDIFKGIVKDILGRLTQIVVEQAIIAPLEKRIKDFFASLQKEKKVDIKWNLLDEVPKLGKQKFEVPEFEIKDVFDEFEKTSIWDPFIEGAERFNKLLGITKLLTKGGIIEQGDFAPALAIEAENRAIAASIPLKEQATALSTAALPIKEAETQATWIAAYASLAAGSASKALGQAKAYEALATAIAEAAKMPFPASLAAIPMNAGTVMGALAAGTAVAAFAKGGTVPEGYPNDTFPAMLTSGEVIIPKEKVKDPTYIAEVLDVPGFQKGLGEINLSKGMLGDFWKNFGETFNASGKNFEGGMLPQINVTADKGIENDKYANNSFLRTFYGDEAYNQYLWEYNSYLEERYKGNDIPDYKKDLAWSIATRRVDYENKSLGEKAKEAAINVGLGILPEVGGVLLPKALSVAGKGISKLLKKVPIPEYVPSFRGGAVGMEFRELQPAGPPMDSYVRGIHQYATPLQMTEMEELNASGAFERMQITQAQIDCAMSMPSTVDARTEEEFAAALEARRQFMAREVGITDLSFAANIRAAQPEERIGLLENLGHTEWNALTPEDLGVTFPHEVWENDLRDAWNPGDFEGMFHFNREHNLHFSLQDLQNDYIEELRSTIGATFDENEYGVTLKQIKKRIGNIETIKYVDEAADGALREMEVREVDNPNNGIHVHWLEDLQTYQASASVSGGQLMAGKMMQAVRDALPVGTSLMEPSFGSLSADSWKTLAAFANRPPRGIIAEPVTGPHAYVPLNTLHKYSKLFEGLPNIKEFGFMPEWQTAEEATPYLDRINELVERLNLPNKAILFKDPYSSFGKITIKLPNFKLTKIADYNTLPPTAPKLQGGGIIPQGYPNDTFPAWLTSGEAVVPPNVLANIKIALQNKYAADPIVQNMTKEKASWDTYMGARETYTQTIEEVNKPIQIDPSQYFKVVDLEGNKAGLRHGAIVYKDILADLAKAAAIKNVPLVDALTTAMRESGIGYNVLGKGAIEYIPKEVMQAKDTDTMKGMPLDWDHFRMEYNLVDHKYVEKGKGGWNINNEPYKETYPAILKYSAKYAEYLKSFEIDPSFYEPFLKEMQFLKEHIGQRYNQFEKEREDRLAKDREVVLKNLDMYNFADSVYKANQPRIAGFQTGGEVPAGYPNDTYPAMLTSGEIVIPDTTVFNDLTKSINELIATIDDTGGRIDTTLAPMQAVTGAPLKTTSSWKGGPMPGGPTETVGPLTAEQIAENQKAVQEYYKSISKTSEANKGLAGISSGFATVAKLTQGDTQSWAGYAATVVGTIPGVVSAMNVLIIAHKAKQQAAAGDAVAEAAAGAMTMGPILGVIMLAASVAAVIAALASAPKMAKGGIIPPGYKNDSFHAMLSSGEAVIPLDTLQNQVETEGNVRFVIEGDKLVGILDKQNKRGKIY
jgi:TP901 family phage tail tape measure protein